ncbi:uncharacterized protein ACA1_104000 [Acanthamoeba castellanii str. Neff]|uniref:Uncharacterized protein n=1 Tax=Acanthamoeba castellanii (strain ATCC 30010 / Neff) TaxID=1257118 RepID=L8GD46_ACACF|nr:uncharacterized protein ACA1_104000 [Acanthamoeba castellanii str. Neff]ELR10982.1 hypothetical protein ACA1_104000 [Acanthamoeba castellanii str. Neff]
MHEGYYEEPRRVAPSTPTDAAQMKADLEMCPPWILSKLKTERDLRRKLAEQTKEQTRILLEEVKDWRAKAYNYQREAQEKEAQRKKKQEELDRIKEMLQQQLAEKDEQLAKKNEILALLKQRFLQFQEAKKEAQGIVASSPMPSNLSLSSSWDASKSAAGPSSPTMERPPGSPGRGGWEAAAAKSGHSVRPASPTRGLVTPSSPSLSTSSGSGALASGSSGGALGSTSSSGSGMGLMSGQRLHSSSVSAVGARAPLSPVADKRPQLGASEGRYVPSFPTHTATRLLMNVHSSPLRRGLSMPHQLAPRSSGARCSSLGHHHRPPDPP